MGVEVLERGFALSSRLRNLEYWRASAGKAYVFSGVLKGCVRLCGRRGVGERFCAFFVFA